MQRILNIKKTFWTWQNILDRRVAVYNYLIFAMPKLTKCGKKQMCIFCLLKIKPFQFDILKIGFVAKKQNKKKYMQLK